MKLNPSATIPAALAICLSLACTKQPVLAARMGPAAGSLVESAQGADVDSSNTRLAVTYIGPDVLQPLLTVTVQDENGVRTVSGRDLSTFREIGGDGYSPELTLHHIPVPDTVRARIQIRRAEDDTTTVADVAFSEAVVSELTYQIHVIPRTGRPFGTSVIRVYAVPFAHPAAPGIGDSLFVVWRGYIRHSPWTFDMSGDSASSQSLSHSSDERS